MIDADRLIWEPEVNVAHMRDKHGVNREEVEEVCRGDYVVAEGYAGRLRIIGPTVAGRMLTVILNPKHEQGLFYPVTARPASRQERAVFRRSAEE
jgi:hypothetical protein